LALAYTINQVNINALKKEMRFTRTICAHKRFDTNTNYNGFFDLANDSALLGICLLPKPSN